MCLSFVEALFHCLQNAKGPHDDLKAFRFARDDWRSHLSFLWVSSTRFGEPVLLFELDLPSLECVHLTQMSPEVDRRLATGQQVLSEPAEEFGTSGRRFGRG